MCGWETFYWESSLYYWGWLTGEAFVVVVMVKWLACATDCRNRIGQCVQRSSCSNGVMVIVNGETCVVGRHLTGNGLVLLGRLIGEAFSVVLMVSW